MSEWVVRIWTVHFAYESERERCFIICLFCLVLLLYSTCITSSVQFRMVCMIYMLKKTTTSLRNFPSVAFETVTVLVWLMMTLYSFLLFCFTRKLVWLMMFFCRVFCVALIFCITVSLQQCVLFCYFDLLSQCVAMRFVQLYCFTVSLQQCVVVILFYCQFVAVCFWSVVLFYYQFAAMCFVQLYCFTVSLQQCVLFSCIVLLSVCSNVLFSYFVLLSVYSSVYFSLLLFCFTISLQQWRSTLKVEAACWSW